MEIGERIRWLRKLKNMKIETLADIVGVTRQTISRYETGGIEDIPKGKLEKIAAALDTTIDYIYGVTIESQCDSVQYELQKLYEDLKSAKEDEKYEIEASIAILQESYEDLLFVKKIQGNMQSPMGEESTTRKRHTIKDRVKEWHSDKKAILTMNIDSWLLMALKGAASDSQRSLEDEIEMSLYDHIMYLIEKEMPTEDVTGGK